MLAALICALQILPAVEMAALSVRAHGIALAERGEWSFPLVRLVELIHPFPFGSYYSSEWLRDDLYPRRRWPWADSVYIGLAPVALALFALRRDWSRAWPWLVLLLVAVIATLGAQLPGFALVSDLPFVATQRYPEKLLLHVTLALCVLATLGADSTSAGSAPTAVWRRTLFVSLLVLAGSVAAVYAFLRQQLGEQFFLPSQVWSSVLPGSHSWFTGGLLHATLMASVIAVAVALGATRRRGLAITLLFVAALDTTWLHWRHVPTMPAAVLADDQPPQLFAQLRAPGRLYSDARAVAHRALRFPVRLDQRIGTHWPDAAQQVASQMVRRVLRARETLERNVAVEFERGYLNGEFSPLEPAAHQPWLQTLGVEHGHFLMAISAVRYVLTPILPHARAWNDVGFVEVYRDEQVNIRVLEVDNPLPLAYTAAGREAPAELSALVSTLTDYRREVAIQGARPFTRPGEVDIELRRPEHWRFAVRAGPQGTILVVNETFYPGWRARVDGQSVPVQSANARFMAIRIPPGTHSVDLRFEPTHFRLALALSAVGLLLALICALWSRSPESRVI